MTDKRPGNASPDVYDQNLVEAIMTDDGGPQPERGSDTRSQRSNRNRPALDAAARAWGRGPLKLSG
jgi:hypothetical protein